MDSQENIGSKINKIKKIYESIKDKIESRLEEFKNIWKYGSNEDVFIELAFCILTPQSKAKTCWRAVRDLVENDLIFSNDIHKIAETINPVRFKNNKAGYIVNAFNLLCINNKLLIKDIINKYSDIMMLREWLVDNIKGIGYKEASHFLRNIGFGDNIAILDRHILKNLFDLDIIKEIPKSINKNLYYIIEKKMIEFSKKININPTYLDFVLWYKEAGEVFK